VSSPRMPSSPHSTTASSLQLPISRGKKQKKICYLNLTSLSPQSWNIRINPALNQKTHRIERPKPPQNFPPQKSQNRTKTQQNSLSSLLSSANSVTSDTLWKEANLAKGPNCRFTTWERQNWKTCERRKNAKATEKTISKEESRRKCVTV
jgi:hypothetical protein